MFSLVLFFQALKWGAVPIVREACALHREEHVRVCAQEKLEFEFHQWRTAVSNQNSKVFVLDYPRSLWRFVCWITKEALFYIGLTPRLSFSSHNLTSRRDVLYIFTHLLEQVNLVHAQTVKTDLGTPQCRHLIIKVSLFGYFYAFLREQIFSSKCYCLTNVWFFVYLFECVFGFNWLKLGFDMRFIEFN